jgi:hypothetical protein
MILPQIVGAVANKIVGNGMPCECPDDVAECTCGDAEKTGDGMSGGSGFASGTMMDTGFDRTIGSGMSAGVRKYKKKPSKMGCGSSGGAKRKSKSTINQYFEGVDSYASRIKKDAEGIAEDAFLIKDLTSLGRDDLKVMMAESSKKKSSKKGAGRSGAGIISSLGIPLISNVAGMFGLGQSGAGLSAAGLSAAGVSGGAFSHSVDLTKGDMTFLKKVRERLEKGMKPTKKQTEKILSLHGAGKMKMKGGFLPALLGSIAMPIISKILGGGMSGGAELGLPTTLAGEGMAGAAKKRGRKSKMGKGMSGGALVPVANMHASSMAGQGRSGAGVSGGAAKDRRAIVKKVMKERGIGMIEASKYVKAHGLY